MYVEDPEVSADPPVDAAYQSIASEYTGVADMVTVPVEHLELLLALGALGVIHIFNTLLSAAPVQSLKQSTLANRLNQGVCVN